MMRGAVSIVVGTFGDPEYWDVLAGRAIDSAKNQTVAAEVIRSHGKNLMEARNFGADEATGEWLIFLDADDELDAHYVEFMLTGTGDIRQPSTLGIVNGVPDNHPVLIPETDLSISNFLVIGSMVRRDRFLDVGGFADLPVLEDWHLWQRLVLKGATIGKVPQAIYKVHVRSDSRNNNQILHNQIYSQIRAELSEAWAQRP